MIILSSKQSLTVSTITTVVKKKFKFENIIKNVIN